MVDFTFDFSGILDKNSFTDRRRLLKAEFESINEKHKDFFHENDNIFNHCIIYTHRDTVKFYFTDNLIPENIQKECFDAYKKVCIK
jgi:hypothetical protein